MRCLLSAWQSRPLLFGRLLVVFTCPLTDAAVSRFDELDSDSPSTLLPGKSSILSMVYLMVLNASFSVSGSWVTMDCVLIRRVNVGITESLPRTLREITSPHGSAAATFER